MKIYINGKFLTQRITGVQRYAIEVIKALDQILIEHENKFDQQFIIITPKTTVNNIELKKIKIKKVGIFKGCIWEQFELPLYTTGKFLVNLCNVAPVLKKNQVVTIHDMAVYAYPQGFSFAFRYWYKILFWILGKTLKKIITDSEFSRTELYNYCNVPFNRIAVIQLGVDHILKIQGDEILKKYNLQDKSFVFAVSSLNPNKNFKTVLEAACINSHITFVIAGGANPKVFGANTLALPTNVKYIGYISDEELVGFYQHAGCFLYPSLYEGFGLPPVEAMAFGCPVIVSKSASLPEVCGDAAIYCDPYNISDIADKVRLLFINKEKAHEFASKGLKHSRKYRWNNTVQKIFDNIY